MPAAALVVDLSDSQGHVNPSLAANIGYDGIYGATVPASADPAFQWLRQSGAIRYVRLKNWLGDGFLQRWPEVAAGCETYTGNPAEPYRWAGIDAVLDRLAATGVRPILVCGGLPDALAKGPPRRNASGALINPPADLNAYRLLLTRALKHFEKRYGRSEVRAWFFEVWDAPDRADSWGGTEAEFLALYDHFAAAVFAADSKLRVGGPAADDEAFLCRFVEHCLTGENAVTGKPGARLDFVSGRQTPDDGRADLPARLRGDFPDLAARDFIVSDWRYQPGEEEAPPSPGEPGALVHTLLAALDAPGGPTLIVRSGDLLDDHFDGQRALLTRLGNRTVPNQVFRLFELLARMGDERLSAHSPAGWRTLATRSSQKGARDTAQVLVCRAGADGPPRAEVELRGFSPTLLRLPYRLYRIDDLHRNAYGQWAAAGRPIPAPASLAGRLLGGGLIEPDDQKLGLTVREGVVRVTLDLPPQSLVLLTFGAEPQPEARLSRRGRRVRAAETAYLAAAKLHIQGQLPAALAGYQDVAKRFADTYWSVSALQTLAGLYELELKAPARAEAVRRELLHRPLNRQDRLRLYRRLLIDTVRRGDREGQRSLEQKIARLGRRLGAIRTWNVAATPESAAPKGE